MRTSSKPLVPLVLAAGPLAFAFGTAIFAGCKARTFNAEGKASAGTEAGQSGLSKSVSDDGFTANERALERRAGLALLFPPAADERGLARLPRLLDFGFTPTDIEAMLRHMAGEAPSARAIEAGDVVNSDTPRARRTITNEACFRDPAMWRLTFAQSLPYERAVPGSYSAIAAFEKDAGQRLLVPLAVRATFQPWCVSERTPTRTQVFVLEQAIQLEFRIYDTDPKKQRALSAQVARTTEKLLAQKAGELRAGADASADLVELGRALSTRERAALRRELLDSLEDLTHAWRRGLTGAKTDGFAPFDAFLQASAGEGLAYTAPDARNRPPVHPGLVAQGVFADAVRAYLARLMTKETLHVGRATFSESNGAPNHTQFRIDHGAFLPVPHVTAQLLQRPGDIWQLAPLLDTGFVDSVRDTGNVPRFEMGDSIARTAFDAVDIAPASYAGLSAAERSALRKRLENPDRIHATTTHCSLCHGLAERDILAGHTESRGAQLSSLTVLRAAQDASALARELGTE